MINLIERFKKHLQAREDALRSFCKCAVQVEGWFKGELIAFLEKEGVVFDREVRIGNKQIDFQVPPALIELKHWLIGDQQGKSYDACWYFKQGLNGPGIQADFEKLSAIEGDRYILIATTAKPSQDDWQKGVQLFNERASKGNSRIRSITDVAEYPDYFFLGLLRLELASANSKGGSGRFKNDGHPPARRARAEEVSSSMPKKQTRETIEAELGASETERLVRGFQEFVHDFHQFEADFERLEQERGLPDRGRDGDYSPAAKARPAHHARTGFIDWRKSDAFCCGTMPFDRFLCFCERRRKRASS